MSEKKVTVLNLLKKKGSEKIVTVTAYDYPGAVLAERAGVDVILVGDSAGMVVLGYDSTIPVSMDEMIILSRAVARGATRPLIVGDMPFLSFNISLEEAVRNAGRFVKEGGVDAVKIEGGADYEDTVRAIRKAGIPVMAHIGLLPQSATLWSGYRVQGRTAEETWKLVQDAKAMERAGAFSIVIELVTDEAARLVTETVTIPTIGVGAGPHCDGQVLVYHDLLGLYDRIKPKFVKRYLDLSKLIEDALRAYRSDVLAGIFPGEENSFHMEEEEARKLEGSGR